MLTDYRRQITNRTEDWKSPPSTLPRLSAAKFFRLSNSPHMCRWYCLFSNCCRASHRPLHQSPLFGRQVPRETNLCLCAHQLGSSRSHSCVAEYGAFTRLLISTSVLTTCVNRMHRHHDSPMISRVPRSHYCFFPKTGLNHRHLPGSHHHVPDRQRLVRRALHRRPCSLWRSFSCCSEGSDARKRAETSPVNQVLPFTDASSHKQESNVGAGTQNGNPPTFRVSDVGAGPCFWTPPTQKLPLLATVVGHPLSHHRRQSFSAALTIHYLSFQRRQTSTASATVRILTHHRYKTIAGGPYGTSAATTE